MDGQPQKCKDYCTVSLKDFLMPWVDHCVGLKPETVTMGTTAFTEGLSALTQHMSFLETNRYKHMPDCTGADNKCKEAIPPRPPQSKRWISEPYPLFISSSWEITHEDSQVCVQGLTVNKNWTQTRSPQLRSWFVNSWCIQMIEIGIISKQCFRGLFI